MARPKLHQREETLKKALSFFWKNGFSGGSTRELGQALGLHPGSIYSSFGSKEKLYLEAIELYVREFEGVFVACFEGRDFFGGLTEFLSHLVSDSGHPCTCFLAKTYSSQLNNEQILADRAKELVAEFRRSIAAQIIEAQSKGELSTELDPEAFASVVQTQIMGLRTLADSAPGDEVLKRAVKDVVKLLEQGAKMG